MGAKFISVICRCSLAFAGFVISSNVSANAQTFNQFFGFGDSTIDSGWYKNAPPNSTNATYNSDFATALTQGGGEATTNPGLVSSQYLAGSLNLTAIPADQPGGTNYATGGARNNQSNIGVSGLLQGAVATDTQIANYLIATNGVANGNALYLISSGGNDVTFAVNNLAGAAQTTYVITAGSELVAAIARLAAAGARYIVVPDQPQSFGDATTQSLRTAYDDTLWDGLAAAHVNFIPVDVNAMYRAVTSDFAEFGLIAGAGPACTQPAGITSAWATLCSPTSTISTLVSPDAAQTHLFADDEHLATAGQQILADYEYSLIVAPSEMSFLAEVPVKTRAAVVAGILDQISISQRQRAVGTFNAWMTGDVSSLRMNSGYTDFPNDPGVPVSGTVGVDYAVANGWLVGAAMSVGNTTQSFDLGGSFQQNEFAASAFAAVNDGPIWADFVGTFGGLRYETDRIVPIGITMQSNSSGTAGTNASFAAEAGYNFFAGSLTQGPVAGILLQRVYVNGFTETDAFAAVGGFTALSFADQMRNSAVTELGYRMNLSFGAWQPFAKIVWNHELASLDRSVTASLTTISAPSYSLPAVIFGADWATATLGTTVTINSAVTASAAFTTEVAQNNVVDYGAQLGLNVALNLPGKAN